MLDRLCVLGDCGLWMLVFLFNWIQNQVPGNLDLYRWKTETVQRCLHWLQAVIAIQEQTAAVKQLEQLLQERLCTKRKRMTHEKEKRKVC